MVSRTALNKILRSTGRAYSTARTRTPLLVSAAQVRELSPSANVSVLDATWFMPNAPRNARQEFMSKRIPGAQFFDLDEVASSHELGLKHMMPAPRTFADACENFGIRPDTHVIIYDAHGVFSSPRALFTFRSFGHEKSSILDGGLPSWDSEGFKVETSPPKAPARSEYAVPTLRSNSIKSYDQVVENSDKDPLKDSSAELVLDARPNGRFTGKDPEPRPGMSSGHIPNSSSLPFNVFLKTHTSQNSSAQFTKFKSPEEIRQALIDTLGAERTDLVLKGERTVTATCGSGMTAAVIWLGLKLLGVENVGVYDESWTGYASRASSKIKKSVDSQQ